MPHIKELIGETAYNALPEDKRKELGDKDYVDSSNYVEKKELETANNNIKQYKKDIAKRDKDIEDLQGRVKDNAELNTEIENLKTANKKASEDYESKLKQLNFDTKFEKAIAQYKTKNPKALKALLDMTKINLTEDGTFIGLEEQMKTLKESDNYLFEQEQSGGTGFLGGDSSSLINDKKGELGLGARLAKERAEAAKVTEVQNVFFK